MVLVGSTDYYSLDLPHFFGPWDMGACVHPTVQLEQTEVDEVAIDNIIPPSLFALHNR